MSVHRAHGPLDSVKDALKFFMLTGGFSLYFKADTGLQLHFSWIRCLLQIATIAGLETLTPLCIFFSMVRNPDAFVGSLKLFVESENENRTEASSNMTKNDINFLFNEGTTNLDKIIMSVGPMGGLICLIILFYIWGKKTESFLELNNKFLQVSHYFNAAEIGTKSTKSAKRKVWLIYALAAATSLMFVLFWRKAIPEDAWEKELLLNILSLVFVPFTILAGAINPAMVCSLHLITFFIMYMSEHFAHWTDTLRTQLGQNGTSKVSGSHKASRKVYAVASEDLLSNLEKKDLSASQAFEITKHMEIGFKLCKIAQYLNQCLGSTIFVYFCSTLCGSVACLFASSTILFHITNTMLQYFTMAYGLMGIVFILLVYFACSAGQNLENQRAAAREQLDLYHTRYVTYLDDSQRFQLKILSERLEKFGTLKPLAYFHVNHSTHLGGISTMITYLIVLMQFKVSNVVSE